MGYIQYRAATALTYLLNRDEYQGVPGIDLKGFSVLSRGFRGEHGFLSKAQIAANLGARGPRSLDQWLPSCLERLVADGHLVAEYKRLTEAGTRITRYKLSVGTMRDGVKAVSSYAEFYDHLDISAGTVGHAVYLGAQVEAIGSTPAGLAAALRLPKNTVKVTIKRLIGATVRVGADGREVSYLPLLERVGGKICIREPEEVTAAVGFELQPKHKLQFKAAVKGSTSSKPEGGIKAAVKKSAPVSAADIPPNRAVRVVDTSSGEVSLQVKAALGLVQAKGYAPAKAASLIKKYFDDVATLVDLCVLHHYAAPQDKAAIADLYGSVVPIRSLNEVVARLDVRHEANGSTITAMYTPPEAP